MLGETLRLIRVFHDKKAAELAKDLDIYPGYLSEIESGKKQPSLELIQKYAEAFKTTSSAILLFSDQLEQEKLHSPFKVSIRNKLFKLLKSLEGDAFNDKDLHHRT